ncbi:restriction endonuclease subunit S [Convivina praedatoris]|uniref:restriction endonuclease subunit S n=1 Tax=Convivina praedatoris TaxID=2880963 RepID=UPI0021119916|nr:restriction endonuclease subunit S [Convivina sp. LMG 32447]
MTAWQKRKLGSFTETYSGGTPSADNSKYYGGDIPFIRSAEINLDKTKLYLTEAGLNNSSAKLVAVGDILYAMYGATSGEVGVSRINGAINQAILAIKPTQNDDPQFIMQWLRNQKEHIVNIYLQGGQGNLSGTIVKKLEIETPVENSEELRIGIISQSLDNLITVNQRKNFYHLLC